MSHFFSIMFNGKSRVPAEEVAKLEVKAVSLSAKLDNLTIEFKEFKDDVKKSLNQLERVILITVVSGSLLGKVDSNLIQKALLQDSANVVQTKSK